MVKLDARINEGGNVVLSMDSFEHLLACLDNQKFIQDVNADGLDGGGYKETQRDNQAAIDDFNRQCRKLLRFGKIV